MFTGLVHGVGSVVSRCTTTRGEHLTVDARSHLEGVRTGDSISVNGVCLTVTECVGTHFGADVIPQTLSMTTLGTLSVGEEVNL